VSQLAPDLEVIRRRRILFLHHSVGRDVLAGIEQLDLEAGGSRLRLASLAEAARIDGPVLAHGSGGRNEDPRSKIEFFASTVRAGVPLRPDLALMKLCYVDFHPRTDVEELLSAYRGGLESLKRDHPEIPFAHVTVPLCTRPTDPKSTLRRLMGREVWGDAANVKRAQFNQRLAESFPSDPIFDLARAEAAGPGGGAATFEQGGLSYPCLHPRYTQDGGHLNPLGRRAAGAAAIRFLAAALGGRREASCR
jgi:hypothetical protein